jgi:hypothetical protein
VCRADETIRILALHDSRIVPLRSRLVQEVGLLARLGDAPGVQQMIDDRGALAPWNSAASKRCRRSEGGSDTSP